jgi:hypothetical protein
LVSTVAYVCRKKTKGSPQCFCPFFSDMAWGGGERAQQMGACPGTRPAIFTRVFADDERSDEGEGDTSTPTPSPQAAITIETSITRVPTK